MPAAEVKALISMIVAYSAGGETVKSDSVMANVAFVGIKQSIDRINDYAEKQRENGKKGGRPVKNGESEDNPEKPNETQQNPTITQQNPTITQQNPTITQQNPTITQQNPTITQQNPTITQQKPEKASLILNHVSLIQEKEKIDKKEKAASRFSPPSIDEVREYCRERGNKISPESFMDHYTANGWMVGKNKMKDWKAAVRNWEKREAEWRQKKNGSQGFISPMPSFLPDDLKAKEYKIPKFKLRDERGVT